MARQPDLDIVGLRRLLRQVAGHQPRRAEVQAQLGDQPLDLHGQRLQLVIASLRRGQDVPLDLVELVDADQPALARPVRPRLAAETRRVGHHPQRQLVDLEDFVAVQAGQDDLGGRDQVQIIALGVVDLVVKLGQHAGRGHHVGVDRQRRQDRLVALGHAARDAELDQRPLQPRAPAAVARPAAAGDLRAAREIDQTERLGEGHVVPRLEVETRRLAVQADDFVEALVGARQNALVRQVRQIEQRRLEVGVGHAAQLGQLL